MTNHFETLHSHRCICTISDASIGHAVKPVGTASGLWAMRRHSMFLLEMIWCMICSQNAIVTAWTTHPKSSYQHHHPWHTRSKPLFQSQQHIGADCNNNNQNHKHNKSPQLIITCGTSKELVAAIRATIAPHHTVAELGAQLRSVSQAIQQQTPLHSRHVDVVRQFPKQQKLNGTSTTGTPWTAEMRRPHDRWDTFEEIQSLDDWRQAFVEGTTYSVLVLDVHAIVGNDLPWTSLAILQEFSHRHQTNLVLVKSESLNRMATQLVHGERWIHGEPLSSQEMVHHLPTTIIIATVGVDQYRATIPRAVKPGDTIMEIGCHLGTTTKLLQEAAAGGVTIGVDVSPKIIQRAIQRYPDLCFVVEDAWNTGRLLKLLHLHPTTNGWNVIFVDVGGLSGADGLLDALVLLNNILNAMEPRVIAIKSACVQQLSKRLIPFWRYNTKPGKRSGE